MPLDPTVLADEVAVGAASATFAATMVVGNTYQLVSTTAAWFQVGAAPTAVLRTAGSSYIPPNYPMLVICQPGKTKLAIIQDAAGGFASLTLNL